MASSPRAPFLPLRLLSPGLLRVWAVLVLLGGALGCARGAEAPPPRLDAEVEGHWLQSIGPASRLAPCGHGDHAWAWSPGRAGLWLVDAEGTSRQLAPEVFTPRFEVMSVVPTADASRAWVHVVMFSSEARMGALDSRSGPPEHGVFLVDHQGLVGQGEPVMEATHAALEDFRLVPSENREQLWVVAPGQRSLQLVDALGRVKAVELGSSQKWTWSLVSRSLPLGDGQQGWLVLNEGLYFLDLKSSANPLGPNLLSARLIQDIHPTSEPGTAWVLSQRDFASPLQLFLIRRSEARKSPVALFGGARVLQLSARPGGSQAWVVLDETPQTPKKTLLLLDSAGRPVNASPREVVDREPLLAHSREGDTWLRDGARLHLLDSAGNPVAVSEEREWLGGAELVPLPGRRAWAMTQKGSIFLVESKEGRLAIGPPLLTGLRGPVPVGWSARGGWLLSEGNTTLHRLTFEQGTWTTERLLSRGQLSGVFPLPDSPRAWIADLPRSHIVGPASDVRAVVLGFAGGGRLELRAGQEPRVQGTLLAGATLERLELDWPGRKAAEQAGHTVTLEVFNEDEEGRRVADGLLPLAAPAHRLQWSEVPNFISHPYRIVLTHRVEDGSDFSVTFHHVPFAVPLFERVWVRTVLACLAVTLLVFLPMLLLRPSDRTRRWLPLVGYTVSLAGAGGGELLGRLEALRIHLPTFVAVVGAELLGCAVLGLLSPAVFRRLVFTHPFTWLAPLLLRMPGFRRRFFRTYVQRVRTRVDIDSARANGEQYVELGSHVTEQTRPGAPPTAGERTAEGLRDLLLGEHLHLFIQCAGGRGKSALLRQLVRLSLERFEQRPDSPLPVLIDPSAEDLEKAAREALDELGLPEALRDLLLEAGDFFLVLDGLTESRLPPERLRQYVEREVGTSAPLLVTARPNEEFQAALEHAARWARVEPHRLDDRTLPRFQRAYQGLAAEASLPVLPEPLLRICRGGGAAGTYVPLLVRLSLKFGGGDVDSIISLYRAVFAGLLRKAPEEQATSRALEFAQELCLKVYWEQRSRLIVFRDHPRREQLEDLLEAGLLVPAGGGSALGEPTHVRFFHDSMQSYLTARALYARDAFQQEWDCLWRAAGEPAFAREASDLLVGGGSELFQMCAYVFGNDARLRNELMRHLQLCAEANDEKLNKESILLAIPEELRAELREKTRGLGPGPLLREASLACLDHAGGESLYLLYARIAQLAWPWTVPASPDSVTRDAR